MSKCGVKQIKLRKVDIGKSTPRVDGAKVSATRDDEIVLDFKLTYGGNCEIAIDFLMKYGSVGVSLKNISFSGTFRSILTTQNRINVVKGIEVKF